VVIPKNLNRSSINIGRLLLSKESYTIDKLKNPIAANKITNSVFFITLMLFTEKTNRITE
jgi:hypothetical protein